MNDRPIHWRLSWARFNTATGKRSSGVRVFTSEDEAMQAKADIQMTDPDAAVCVTAKYAQGDQR